jgi:hypothetical protein
MQKKGIIMGIVLNRGKFLVPKKMKEIKYISHAEKNALQIAMDIAKKFGEQSKKQKPKKIIIR